MNGVYAGRRHMHAHPQASDQLAHGQAVSWPDADRACPRHVESSTPPTTSFNAPIEARSHLDKPAGNGEAGLLPPLPLPLLAAAAAPAAAYPSPVLLALLVLRAMTGSRILFFGCAARTEPE